MAAEMGQADAPRRGPGPFLAGGARPVQASESLLPICTTVAPRIPGLSTQAACRCPLECQHQTPATHSSMSLCQAKPLFGSGQHTSLDPSPH